MNEETATRLFMHLNNQRFGEDENSYYQSVNASLDNQELELPQDGNSLVEYQHFCDQKKKKQRFQKIKTKYKNFNE